MKITKKALLDRGFKETSWFDETNHTEYIYQVPSRSDQSIEVTLSDNPTTLVINEDGLVRFPNCRTLKQLDNLIDLFKEK